MTRPAVSFEFFPPKSLRGSFRLWECLRTLAPLGPEWVSVTYGAGGSTRELTREAVAAIGPGFGLPVAGHLTCVGASRAETMEAAREFREAGACGVVALRGDPPEGEAAFEPHPEGFEDSVELVAALAREGFDVRVGCYPDGHPEAASPEAEVDWLRRKVEAGASEAVSQFFFDAEPFLRFRDRCAAAGIGAPIVPGVLPVGNWARAASFADGCGARIPGDVRAGFDAAEREGRAEAFALEQATALAERLVAEGCDHLHFYTMNRAALARDVCRALGIDARPSLDAVA